MSKRTRNILQEYWMIFIWIGLWISGILFDFSSLQESEETKILLLITGCLLAVMFAILSMQKDPYEMVVTVILLISIWVRFMYAVKMGYDYSNHDLGVMVSGSNYEYEQGHLGYIQYIYQNGRIPDFDPRIRWSFYNPPFYYMVMASFLKINSLFLSNMRQMMENMQLLTMLFATLTIQTGYKVLKEFHIRGMALVAAVAFLAFHPYFIIGGTTLNNDILSVLFLFLSILYVIRWFKQGRLVDILKVALCIGLGMMTKISVGVVAVPVAFLFLGKLLKERQYWKRYLAQFVLFGVLCIPLGMLWPVRNVCLFDMPLVYVQEINPNSTQQIKEASVIDRINPFDRTGYDSPYLGLEDPKTSYNMWMGLFKTSVFDERNSNGIHAPFVEKVSWMLLGLGIILGILSIVMGVYVYFGRHQAGIWNLLAKSLLMLVFLASYIKFCFRYSVICSMSFRYVVPLLLVVAINIGLYVEEDRVSRRGKGAIICLVAAFSICSFYLYGIVRF